MLDQQVWMRRCLWNVVDRCHHKGLSLRGGGNNRGGGGMRGGSELPVLFESEFLSLQLEISWPFKVNGCYKWPKIKPGAQKGKERRI